MYINILKCQAQIFEDQLGTNPDSSHPGSPDLKMKFGKEYSIREFFSVRAFEGLHGRIEMFTMKQTININSDS